MSTIEKRTAVVLLSGGQDSATCLAWAKREFEVVHAISFTYGQRHEVELDCAKELVRLFGAASHEVIPVPFGHASLRCGALTAAARIEGSGGLVDAEMPEGLPTTFVPGRNMVFLALAAARAVKVGARTLVTGVCQTDYSGYPDCRGEFVVAMQDAINAAMPSASGPIHIAAPLLTLTKAATVQLMVDLGHLDALAHTHTCYRGDRPPCGECPACVLRAKGFEEAGVADPLLTRWSR